LPNKKENPVNPNPSFLQRFFGSSPMAPEVQQGIDIARKENPNLAPVETYGPISRLFSSRAQAYTSPGKTIYLNPDAMQGQSPQDVADTITHEQAHVNQMNQRGYGPTRELLSELTSGIGTPYHQRPDEMEAYQAEKLRRAKTGRVGATPSFSSGNFVVAI
jgi:hypothetical protein